jgi:hypothetical protein
MIRILTPRRGFQDGDPAEDDSMLIGDVVGEQIAAIAPTFK